MVAARLGSTRLYDEQLMEEVVERCPHQRLRLSLRAPAAQASRLFKFKQVERAASGRQASSSEQNACAVWPGTK